MATEAVSRVRSGLEGLGRLSDQCCIYKVPESLREKNEKAYRPRVVSIGPLHHGLPNLEAMEEHKLRYLNFFLKHRTEVRLERFVELIEERAASVRDCYADSIKFDPVDFIKMILVDAVFIIELFLRRTYGIPPIDIDRIYLKPQLVNDIGDDLCMLENQLPIFIIEDLFNLADTELWFYNIRLEKPSLFDLTYKFFEDRHKTSKIKDLLEDSFQQVKHLLHFVNFCYLPLTLCPQGKETKTLTVPSIKQLHQAGVKFKLGSSNNRYEIEFDNGVLKLPKIEIYDTTTELILRNLLALERCESYCFYVADYVAILKRLLNAPEDVELLVREGIVENWLEDGKAVSTLFQNLCKGVGVSYYNFHYTSLVEDLNNYYNSSWHKWKANLKQNYFNTPWAALSVLAAVVLLILTAMQTVSSVIPLFKKTH